MLGHGVCTQPPVGEQDHQRPLFSADQEEQQESEIIIRKQKQIKKKPT